MKIKALVPFSNGTISMEQYEVREVTDALGNELTSAGVAVEIGGGSGGGALVVNAVYDETTYKNVLDKTWQEIHDAFLTGAVRIIVLNSVFNVTHIYSSYDQSTFVIECVINGKKGVSLVIYKAMSANGYPAEE